MTRKAKPTQEHASEVAIIALNWLAGEPEHLGGFLAATGITPDLLRKAAREPGFLAGVLDYLMQDEALLLSFCASNGLAPDDAVAAHQTLSPQDFL
jgi:hypothetical protein